MNLVEFIPKNNREYTYILNYLGPIPGQRPPTKPPTTPIPTHPPHTHIQKNTFLMKS